MSENKTTRKDFLKLLGLGVGSLSLISIPKIILADENYINIKSAKQLESIIVNVDNERVIANFGMMDCPHCVRYNFVFKRVARECENIKFCNVIFDNIKVTGDPLRIMQKYRIGPIPNTIFFRDGSREYSRTGYLNDEALKNLIEKVYCK